VVRPESPSDVAYLEMRGVHKRYGGVVALTDAALTAERGEVHALLGANGSGKSTLNKVLTGVVAPDHAEIRLDGEPLRISRPQDALTHGIAAVYQELSLIPDLSVAANISLGWEPSRFGLVRPAAARARAEAVLARFAAAFPGRLPIDTPVGKLSPGEQQIVEICKAIAREPTVLVLDEATASLYSAQVEVLFEVVRELRDAGVLVVFTSHRMGEIFAVCDRATVLRNGQVAGVVDLAGTTEQQVVELMVGAQVGAAEVAGETIASDTATRPLLLTVTDLVTDRLDGVSFEVHEGEVLGLGGLAGQGQSELLAALFGASRIRSGTVHLGDRALTLRRPRHAVRAGIAFVPGNRGKEGLFPVRPILENLTVPSMRTRTRPPGVLSRRRERSAAADAVEQLQIKIGALRDAVDTLSGGNQQKVVVGKWLLTEPRIVLLDDPTKGIDVGAKEELYELIARLTAEGVAVLFNSSDDEELLGLSHRVFVFFEGRIVTTLAGEERTRDRLVAASLQVAPT
jgi:ribose transport system ATP-binding protein